MRKKIGFIMGAAVLSTALSGGCGGGGSSLSPQSASNQASTRGDVTVNLQFANRPASRAALQPRNGGRFTPGPTPPYAGNIPFGALSVRITVTNPATGKELAPAGVVRDPADSSGIKPLVTVQFAALPVGPVRLDVSAFPNHDGTGSVLATGSVSGQIMPLQMTTLSAPMALTVRTVTVSPKTVTLDGDTADITASAQDANSLPLDLPLTFFATDPDIVSVFISSSNTARIIPNIARGKTEVVVVEPNSGLFDVVQVESL